MAQYRNSTQIMYDIIDEFGEDRKTELRRELKHYKVQLRAEIIGRVRKNIKKIIEEPDAVREYKKRGEPI